MTTTRILAGNGDTIPGDITTTETVMSGDSFTGQLETEDDVDFIAFEIEAGQTVQIDPDDFLDRADQYSIVDAAGNVLIDNLIALPVPGPVQLVPSNGPLFFTAETSGTFFIRVEGGGPPTTSFIGNFGFTFAVLPDDEIGDTRDTATDITDQTGLISSALNTNEDVDFFTQSFETGQRVTLSFEDDLPGFDGVPGGANPPSSLQIEITDPNGDVVDVVRTTFPDFSIEFDADQAGDYGIRISSQSLSSGVLVGGFRSPYAFSVETAEDNTIVGDGGNNTLDGTSGADDISGLGGNDTLRGFAGDDVLSGGTGNDVLRGGSGDDELRGDAGSDRLFGGSGDDTLFGGAGNDRLVSGDGFDRLFGGAGEDTLIATGGSNILGGGGGNDTLIVRDGSAELRGGGGDDRLFGGDAGDTLRGGTGDDLARGGGGDDSITGEGGNDRLFGATGNDTVSGAEGDDLVAGGRGDDLVFGGAGDDFVSGGGGDDRVSGDGGNDVLLGGGGADTFVFNGADPSGSGFDRIDDFRSGVDVIELQSFGFTDFSELNFFDAGDTVFLFIDENTSIEFTGIDDVSQLSADDFSFIG